MADEVKTQVEETVETVEKQQPTQVNAEEQQTHVDVEEVKTKTRAEIARELSKELSVNVFEAEGLKYVKELIESQKTEQEKLQERLQSYEQERSQWERERLNYEAKLKASELGINPNNMEDALKLADNDPNKLEDIIKKYPIFKSKEGIKIGLQDPVDNPTPTDLSEVEAYMASDPRYKKYYNKK